MLMKKELSLAAFAFSCIASALPYSGSFESYVTRAELLPRAFPIVQGVTSTKDLNKLKGDKLIDQLASDGDKYIKKLDETEKNPPELLDDPKDFLARYKFDLKDKTIDEAILIEPKGKEADLLGVKSGEKMHWLKLTVKNFDDDSEAESECPYTIMLSHDGSTLVNVNSKTADDKCTDGTKKLAFEDIITYAIAYAADGDGKLAGDQKAVGTKVSTAIPKVKRILRDAIKNPVTEEVIKEIFKDNPAWEKKKGVWHTLAKGSKQMKALLATRNGTLAPKLLGTNMAILKRGEVGAIHISFDGETMRMLIELNH